MKAATLRRQAAVILAGGGAILAATAMAATAQASASTSAPAARQTTASGQARTSAQLVVAPTRPLSYWVKSTSRLQWSKTASPRVSCGGYNGHVDYTNDGASITLATYGEVWDTCGATTYLYLSWDELSGLQHHNAQVQTASNHATVGANQSYELFQGASNVGVAVCNTNGGWHCGATQHF
jgi:hypothetical protein